jgi:hypothetical protein
MSPDALVTFAQEEVAAIARNGGEETLLPIELEPEHAHVVVNAGRHVADTQDRGDVLEFGCSGGRRWFFRSLGGRHGWLLVQGTFY